MTVSLAMPARTALACPAFARKEPSEAEFSGHAGVKSGHAGGPRAGKGVLL